MADRPVFRIERVLIERLESRRLLSAGLPVQQQPGFHWFERTGTFGALSAPSHREFAFEQRKVAFSVEASGQTEAPSLAIIAAPDGQLVGFTPLFFGWHPAGPSYAGTPEFHWAGHDAGHDAAGGPALGGPSPLLHTPRLPFHESPEYGAHDSNVSESSGTPQPPQSPGQVTADAGSPIVVVLVTPNSSPQIRVITIPVGIRIEPKVALPEEQGSPAPAQAASGSAASSAPVLERPASTGVTNPFASAPAASALPPFKTTAFPTVGRTAIEAAAVARAAAIPDVPPAQSDGTPIKPSELLVTVVPAPAGATTRIAMTASDPAAAVGAIRIASGWVRSAAAVIGRAVDAPAAISEVQAEYVAPVAYNFLRINPAMLFNDTVGRMIRESASLSPAAASPNHVRAWAITGAVVAADAVLVGYWQVNRRRKLRKLQGQSNWTRRRPLSAALPR